MPSYPDGLPPLFEVDGFGLKPISNSTQIDVESGSPLTRNRFTGEMDAVSGKLMRMTREQAIMLLNFWRYDLKNGTLPFTWDHPLTLEAVEMLMPSVELAGMSGDLWQMSVSVQTLPQ